MNMNKEEFLVALAKEGLLIYGTTWLENFKRLQELKKYKEMWEELIENLNQVKKYNLNIDLNNVLVRVDIFKQKYFPEEETVELQKEVDRLLKALNV